MDYDPKEFTLIEYERLLSIAKKRHVFKKYSNIKNVDDNFIVWRHDVDHSLEQSAIVAKIEKKNAIQSTYFLHLHNEFYNAMDFRSSELIKNILSLGHSVGLHFDFAYYDIQSTNELEHWLTIEKNILEALFKTKISAFSFHNPTDFSMKFERDMYAGMINTYSKYYKNNVEYCSDSNGYWRYRKLAEVLDDKSIVRLQVLTHPEWWTREEMLPREKIKKYIEFRALETLANYDGILEAFGRVNIGA